MTPRRVRKLRSLCARSESSASRSVSPMVTAALRKLPIFNVGFATRRGSTLNPSMGVTPKQTSNVLYLRRNTAAVRSFHIDARETALLSSPFGPIGGKLAAERPLPKLYRFALESGQAFGSREEAVMRRIYVYFLCPTPTAEKPLAKRAPLLHWPLP